MGRLCYVKETGGWGGGGGGEASRTVRGPLVADNDRVKFNEWVRRNPWAFIVLTSVFVFVFLVGFEFYALDQELAVSVAFAGAFSLTWLAVRAAVHLWRTKRSS